MKIYTDKPKEIINVYGVHPDDILMAGDLSEQQSFSMVPHFFYEFNNDPTVKMIYAGLCAGKKGYLLINMPIEDLTQYLLKITKPDTKLCFDNLYEGNVTPMIHVIYQAIKNTAIKPHQIHYFSGALDCDVTLDEYCQEHNITEKINVYGCNAWEYNSKKNTEITEIEFKIKPKQKTFLCFNRVSRYHRFVLAMLFLERGLLKNAFYSFFPEYTHSGGHNIKSFLNNMRSHLSADLHSLVHRAYLMNVALFPLKLNIEASENINWITTKDATLFEESQFSLVTETYFFKLRQYNTVDEQTTFFTEKIFKPILMKHPFIIASRPHALAWLRKMKYKTFHPFIDESYDAIENDEERILAIIKEVERLNEFTPEQWEEWQKQVKSIVEYNHAIIHSKEKHEYAFTRPIQN